MATRSNSPRSARFPRTRAGFAASEELGEEQERGQNQENPETPQPSPDARKARARDALSVLSVTPLAEPSQLEPIRRGRKPRLEMPPMPKAVFDGMTPLEQEHYRFFVESITQDYAIRKPSDLVALHMAALEYINLLRVQASQLASGEIMTAARQHPGVQLRAWLDSMSTTRRARKETVNPEEEEMERWKQGLRKLSS